MRKNRSDDFRAREIVQKPSPVVPNGLLEVDPFLGGFKCTVFKASHSIAAYMLDRTVLQGRRAVICISSHSLVVVGKREMKVGRGWQLLIYGRAKFGSRGYVSGSQRVDNLSNYQKKLQLYEVEDK